MRFIIATLAALVATVAVAQGYPNKPVRFIVATGPGGGDDFTARLVGAKLSDILRQQFVVENRPGAGGMIGQTSVARSAPDGYTILLAGGSMAGARYVNANVTYDLMKDFSPISLIETSPFALVVNPSLPVRNVQEFIALAKSRPGKLNYGSLGAGQIPWWSAFLFQSMTGVQAQEVRYKAIADASGDIIAGRLDFLFTAMVGAVGAKDKLKVLAVTSRMRSDMLPEVPTMIEAGVPGYEMPAWRSVMGPAGMNPEHVQVLNRAIARTLQDPDLRERFAKAGSMPQASTPEELRKRYQDWMEIFGKIARDAKLQPQ
jgi:tripartite-type tricarboxylate transporter receptor subunit TctC